MIHREFSDFFVSMILVVLTTISLFIVILPIAFTYEILHLRK